MTKLLIILKQKGKTRPYWTTEVEVPYINGETDVEVAQMEDIAVDPKSEMVRNLNGVDQKRVIAALQRCSDYSKSLAMNTFMGYKTTPDLVYDFIFQLVLDGKTSDATAFASSVLGVSLSSATSEVEKISKFQSTRGRK